MFEKNVETLINDLIQLDVDATFAYAEAIKKIKEKDIHQQLKEFQHDHDQHIQKLSALLKEIGGTPIELKRDLKGYVIEGYTLLRSVTGTTGALKAMLTNEGAINSKYEDTLEYKGLPREVRKLITENFNDEKRHLAYIKNKLQLLEGARMVS